MTSLQGVRCFKKWSCIIWLFSVFLTCSPVWLSADGVTDSDGDGFPDVVEKHWGSDPANENHFPDWEAEQVACWRLEEGSHRGRARGRNVFGCCHAAVAARGRPEPSLV